MLHRLCEPPSIPLSFSLAAVLPRRSVYRVSFATNWVDSAYSKRAPFTAGTTRVSNPVCSPGFRASASGLVQELAFATGVPLDIYAFHCYTKYSSSPSKPPASQFLMPFPGWARRFHIRLAKPPTHPLRPVNPNNARDLCITAAAGTELAVPSSFITIKSSIVHG